MKDSSEEEAVALLVDIESTGAATSNSTTAEDMEKQLLRRAIWLIFGDDKNEALSSKYARELSCLEELALHGVHEYPEFMPITTLQRSRLIAVGTFHTNAPSLFSLGTTMGEILRANNALAKRTESQNQANDTIVITLVISVSVALLFCLWRGLWLFGQQNCP